MRWFVVHAEITIFGCHDSKLCFWCPRTFWWTQLIAFLRFADRCVCNAMQPMVRDLLDFRDLDGQKMEGGEEVEVDGGRGGR